ncbi:MAG: hypothetical protein CVU43_00665 [Chloroflexi bacterium HGW-Chloroflexi-5]|jgi:hypothetical protein|nr:MAG: hypothetical protein CVU43_00665 [Chloroflexi bacterium HGW-Chloroflexi-5]
MNSTYLSAYQVFSKSITVKDIAEPIEVHVPPYVSIEDFNQRYMFYGDIPYIVSDDYKTYGVIHFDDESLQTPNIGIVADIAKPILVEELISESLPVINLPDLFTESNFYYVLSGVQITHIIRFDDLNSLPMKACIFTLFMELETNFQRILARQSDEDYESLFCKLPAKRLEQINRLYNEKLINKKNKKAPYGENIFNGKNLIGENENDFKNQLSCTNFSDKKEMVKNLPEIFYQLPFTSKTEYDKFFFNVQDMRNRIAHSDSIIDYPHDPQKFSFFIQKLRQVVDIVSNLEKEEAVDFLELI